MTVVLISIVGTLITDNLVDNFGVALETTTLIFSLALLTTFVAWYASEKNLSIHTIFTTRRELFYCAAILFTFALGTAAGDSDHPTLIWAIAFTLLLHEQLRLAGLALAMLGLPGCVRTYYLESIFHWTSSARRRWSWAVPG